MTELTENQSQHMPAFCLATDLDGTFLGGEKSERLALYDWLEAHRAAIQLVFVTGRDLPFIEASCSEGIMPWPDYVVGDVGTTLAARCSKSRRFIPVGELEALIKARWGQGFNHIRQALDAAPGISPQTGTFRHRKSYHYDHQAFDPEIKIMIEKAGFDCLISDNRFLDVLPKGVSKGPSLLRLLSWLSMPKSNVLVAGDTLNDLSLFETGLRGVAVGNSEPALIDKIKSRENVYFAKSHGASGVFEAITAFGFREIVQNAAKLKQEITA